MSVWGQYPHLRLYFSKMAVIVLGFTSTIKHLYAILHTCHDLRKSGRTLILTQVSSTGLEISIGLLMLIDRYSLLNPIF